MPNNYKINQRIIGVSNVEIYTLNKDKESYNEYLKIKSCKNNPEECKLIINPLHRYSGYLEEEIYVEVFIDGNIQLEGIHFDVLFNKKNILKGIRIKNDENISNIIIKVYS